MKRYIAILLLFVCVLFELTGCAKVKTERYEVVSTVITNARYTPARTEYKTDSKGRITPHYYAASGLVEFVCKGRSEYLNGVSYYDRFCDHIGEEVWAINRIRAYDNDKIKERVVNLFETKEQAETVLRSMTNVGDTK